MREDLKSWCQENMLQVKESKTPGVIECDGKTFLLLEEKDGYICDEDFELILSDEEKAKAKSKQVDNFLYKWGTKFYYTPVENAKVLQDDNLRPFEYIGKADTTTPGFPMLGIHGFYEILNGSRKYSSWVDKAKFLDIDTLGICEKNTLAGTLSFQDACVAADIKSILGETITINTSDDSFLEGKVFALNEEGWRNLLLINSEINVFNESQIIKQDKLLELGKGVCFIFDPLLFPYDKLTINKYLKAFDKCFYKIDTVEYDSDVTDQKFLEETQKYLNSDLEPIVLCDAYYLDKDDYRVKPKLNAIGGSKGRGSINQYFKCDDENMEMFSALFEDADYENVLERAYANLDELCQGIDFKIQTGKFKLPEYQMTEEEASQYATNEDLFNALILEGFDKKGLGDLPNADEYIDRIEKEVDVILYGGFVDYFLTLHDIIQWCHKNNILVGFGRGSAAGALISYLLGIVNVDPLKYDLLFERFLTKERARKVFESECVIVSVDNDLELELDFQDKVNIFRSGEKIKVKAEELKDGDKIIDIESRDLSEVLKRKQKPVQRV